MNIEDLREYALSKPAAEESFWSIEDKLLFKVNNKIFLTTPLNASPLYFNVKCEPKRALDLREQYECIKPALHMNKKHWNTVFADGTLSDKQLEEEIDHSYQLVAVKTKKK